MHVYPLLICATSCCGHNLPMMNSISHFSQSPGIPVHRNIRSSSTKKVAFRVLSACMILLGAMFAVFFAQTIGSASKVIHAQSCYNGGTKRKIADSSFTGGEYSSETEQRERRNRFPSVEERVKFYMGAWHTPPCTRKDKVPYTFFNETCLLVREIVDQAKNTVGTTFVVTQKIQMARIIFLDLKEIEACDNGYCSDVKSSMVPTVEKIPVNAPILFQ